MPKWILALGSFVFLLIGFTADNPATAERAAGDAMTLLVGFFILHRLDEWRRI